MSDHASRLQSSPLLITQMSNAPHYLGDIGILFHEVRIDGGIHRGEIIKIGNVTYAMSIVS